MSETALGHLDRWITWIVGAMGEMDGDSSSTEWMDLRMPRGRYNGNAFMFEPDQDVLRSEPDQGASASTGKYQAPSFTAFIDLATDRTITRWALLFPMSK
jgi:hypothetical protein